MDYTIQKQPRVHPNQTLYRTVKRFIDISICLLALPFAIPIMLGCSLAIFFDSPGPILFIQDRMGKGGRLFKMYKFRTMKTNLDQGHFREIMKAYVKSEVNKLGEDKKTFKPFSRGDIFFVGTNLT